MRSLVDGMLYPFRGWPPLIGLVVVSLATAVLILMVFRAASNQQAISQVKRRIHACVFEIRLFKDDFRAILRAQAEILRHNLEYLRLSLVPMLWVAAPLFLLLAQMHFHYGYQGLEPGQTSVLKVQLEEHSQTLSRPNIAIRAPDGVSLDGASVWVPSLREMSWRIKADRSGAHELLVQWGDKSFAKSIEVSTGVVRRSPLRHKGGLVDELLYPAEEPLPADGPIRGISVIYPETGIEVLGWSLHWMVVYCLASMLFVLLLKRPFKVDL